MQNPSFSVLPVLGRSGCWYHTDRPLHLHKHLGLWWAPLMSTWTSLSLYNVPKFQFKIFRMVVGTVPCCQVGDRMRGNIFADGPKVKTERFTCWVSIWPDLAVTWLSLLQPIFRKLMADELTFSWHNLQCLWEIGAALGLLPRLPKRPSRYLRHFCEDCVCIPLSQHPSSWLHMFLVQTVGRTPTPGI